MTEIVFHPARVNWPLVNFDDVSRFVDEKRCRQAQIAMPVE